MKQKIGYSNATGAVALLIVLFFSVCFLDISGLVSYYQTHIQPSFGKTHFIVGYNNNESSERSAAPAQKASLSPSKRILFSPDDDLQDELIKLINQEKESIKIAIFTFTDAQVAQALIESYNRGVIIEVVCDAAYLRDQYSKIAVLQSHKIPVYTYNPHYQNIGKKKQELLSIMHNKFVVFGKNGEDAALVWTGSFNFTRSAKLRNQENVVILDDAYAVKKYSEQFNRLKKRCDGCLEEAEARA